MQCLFADESAMNFKGNVVFKMCYPQKPTKWGLCRCVIGDSTNRYVCGPIPYYG
jgi:hypothetical protein